MEKKRIKAWASLLLDGLLVALIIASIIWMFWGFDGVLLASNAEGFKYFTVESNLFLGIAAALSLPFDIQILQGKREDRPKWLFLINHMAVMSTSVTMLTVFFFLGPTMGYELMFMQVNLLMHLINPIIGLVRYLCFGHEEGKIKWQLSLLGALPVLLYGSVYVPNVVIHNGYGDPKYDWYGFGAGGAGGGILSAFLMTFLTALLGLGLYFAREGIRRLRNRD